MQSLSRIVAPISGQIVRTQTIFGHRPYSIRTQLAGAMASSTRIVIPASDTGLWKGRQDVAAANKVSQLLQEDLEKHHVFFNPSGFHNHLVHQLLTLYSTGAPPSTLQAAYDANKTYQLAHIPIRPSIVTDLQNDWHTHAPTYLGHGKYYSDFLKFFQLQIDQHGWEAVINEFLCADTPKALDIVQRLFSGLAHPMIELSYGLEWEQPAIIAEGLAQAAVHRNVMKEFYDKVDEAVRTVDQSGVEVKYTGMSEICENIRRDHETLAGSTTWQDENRLYDGVLGRGLAEAVALCARIRVTDRDLDERMAEVFHHNAYVAASAAWREPHIPKYDFFLIHSLNSSPFLLALNKPFIPTTAKIRILEHKMRYDIVQYIARGAPPLSMSNIKNYSPQEKVVSQPADLIPRFHKTIDDGHLIKVVRTLLLAQDVSRKWKGREWIRLGEEEDWIKAHYMLLKGVEGEETLWVRSAGFKEAWEGVAKLNNGPRL